MGPTRVNRKLPNECFESGEEQIKGYGKITQNTEIFSPKYGNNISEVGSTVDGMKQLCEPILNHCQLDLRNKLQCNLDQNATFFFQENDYENVVCKMFAILSLPHWVTYNLVHISHVNDILSSLMLHAGL